MLTLNDVANTSRHHVVKLSIPDADGGRPAFGGSEKFQTSRHSREHVLSPRGLPWPQRPRVRRLASDGSGRFRRQPWRGARAGCSPDTPRAWRTGRIIALQSASDIERLVMSPNNKLPSSPVAIAGSVRQSCSNWRGGTPRIVIDYVAHPEATEALEQQVAALGSQSIGINADVSKLADLQRLIDAAVTRFGRLDIMVNNAGIETRTSVLDTTENQYDRVLPINLKSAFFGTQLAAKQMIKQGSGGRIINISSVHED
jgi:short chain dehydrogenase